MPKIKLCAFADEIGAKAEVQIDNLLKNGVYAWRCAAATR